MTPEILGEVYNELGDIQSSINALYLASTDLRRVGSNYMSDRIDYEIDVILKSHEAIKRLINESITDELNKSRESTRNLLDAILGGAFNTEAKQ